MNVKERSSKTVISTGMMRPFSCAVCALNALQNSMMLTPCWPSAGPTGGAGLAWPPGICSLIIVRIFLAISLPQPTWWCACQVKNQARGSGAPRSSVKLLYLVETQLYRHLALEDVDEHLQLLLVRVDVDD